MTDSTRTLPMPALDGEKIVLQGFSRYLLTTPSGAGYNPINGTLTLTSQRLIFEPDGAVTSTQRVVQKAAGARLVSFPVRRITECNEQPMRVQWGNPNVLKLQFDNGGREYFVIHARKGEPSGTWAAALANARANSAELAYDVLPTLKPGFEQPAGRASQRMLLYWVLGVIAVCLFCSMVALLVNGAPVSR